MIAPSHPHQKSSFPKNCSFQKMIVIPIIKIAIPKKLLLPKTIAPSHPQKTITSPPHKKVIALCVPIPSNGNFKV